VGGEERRKKRVGQKSINISLFSRKMSIVGVRRGFVFFPAVSVQPRKVVVHSNCC